MKLKGAMYILKNLREETKFDCTYYFGGNITYVNLDEDYIINYLKVLVD